MSDTAFTGVKAQRPVIEGRTYNATLAGFSDVQKGQNDDYVFWIFHPEGAPDDFEVSCATSLSPAWYAKPMEFARRLTGKSDATDTVWGLELKKRPKRPVIDWGPELIGSECQIVVEKNYDEETETYRNRVVNVLPPGSVDLEEPNFEEIPF